MMRRVRVNIGGQWFDRYMGHGQDFVNYKGGRVIPWRQIAKGTIRAIGHDPTIKYTGER